jgi:hypothetical protein
VQPSGTGQATSIVHAKTREGLELPVIDVTNPHFAVPDDSASLERHRQAFLAWDRTHRRVPAFITRLLLRSAAWRSPLVRALVRSDSGYLDSITTYIMKLGADNLPPGFDGPVDRRIAASPHIVLMRLRMQQVAKLLAEALVEPLRAQTAPLHLINIGGGPALDSINVLILLAAAQPELLQRPILIHVLDAQTDGPAFGAIALAALMSADQPLHGLRVEFKHDPYDWNEPAKLAALVAQLKSQGAIMAASSEGGMFEYGNDEAIVANLKTLHAGQGAVKFVAGSVTSASEVRKRMIAMTKFRLLPRGLEGFAPLAARAGYAIAKNQSAVLSEQVLLRPRV